VSKLFIELYLDEDVSVLVAELLRARGFTAVTARDAGQLEKSDAEQLAYAVSQSKALLTHNRIDFEALARRYFEAGQSHDGIIVAARHAPSEVVRRLLLILNDITVDEMQNLIIYI
jgi:predicted nuclease of predicted toxin-antitoxin system